MEGKAYTLARWYVKAGRESDFEAAWSGELAAYFNGLPGVLHGTLVRSVADPREYYSFGPWESLEHIQAMRANPRTQEVFAVIDELCDEMTPGAYTWVSSASPEG